MMEQVDILGDDRDYSSVENDRNKKETKRVKLTEKSKKNIESKNKFLFSGAMAHMETSLSYEEKADKVEKKLDSQDGLSLEEKAILNLQLTSLRSKQYHYSNKAVKSYNRAIAIKEFMKKNVVDKFRNFCLKISEKLDSFTSNLNVAEVNVPNVDKLFNRSKENKNDIGIDFSALDEEIEKSKIQSNQQPVVGDENTEKKADSEDSVYHFNRENIIQDDIGMGRQDDESEGLSENSEDVFEYFVDNKNVIPTVSNSANTISSVEDNSMDSEVNTDFSSIFASGVNGKASVDEELDALCEALVRAQQDQLELKNDLEQQMIQKENSEKEAKAAQSEMLEKMKAAREQLERYEAENERLRNQQLEVEKETERNLSATQAALNSIDALDKMLAGEAKSSGAVVSGKMRK